MTRKFTDRFGNVLGPGDYVVYGRNLGRCATTAIGRVVEIKLKESRYPHVQALANDGKPDVKIVLDSVQDDQGHDRMEGLPPRIKRLTIQESERVILYDPRFVGDAVRAAFEALDMGFFTWARDCCPMTIPWCERRAAWAGLPERIRKQWEEHAHFCGVQAPR